jgi:chemotaxis protein methyltransferase CheR
VTVAAHDDREVALPFEEIRGAYGCEFRRYSRVSMRQNLARHMVKARLSSLAQLRGRIRADAGAFAGLLEDLTIRVTEMFRDPEFFAALRRLVVPLLRDRAGPRLWIAGCVTGEEVHSAAIVLHEEGLLGRARIYATEPCPAALERAREGIYPAGAIRSWGESYRRAGGTDSFAGYERAAAGAAS